LDGSFHFLFLPPYQHGGHQKRDCPEHETITCQIQFGHQRVEGGEGIKEPGQIANIFKGVVDPPQIDGDPKKDPSKGDQVKAEKVLARKEPKEAIGKEDREKREGVP
jgi:hypothetical protein